MVSDCEPPSHLPSFCCSKGKLCCRWVGAGRGVRIQTAQPSLTSLGSAAQLGSMRCRRVSEGPGDVRTPLSFSRVDIMAVRDHHKFPSLYLRLHLQVLCHLSPHLHLHDTCISVSASLCIHIRTSLRLSTCRCTDTCTHIYSSVSTSVSCMPMSVSVSAQPTAGLGVGFP